MVRRPSASPCRPRLPPPASTPGAIAGIGVSAGAHIPVLTDADGTVIRPAIMWNDQRSAAEAAELHGRAGGMIIATSLNRANPTWSLPMLAWLQKHEPHARRQHQAALSCQGLPAFLPHRNMGDRLQRRRRRADGR